MARASLESVVLAIVRLESSDEVENGIARVSGDSRSQNTEVES
jgi:hypothetical protein